MKTSCIAFIESNTSGTGRLFAQRAAEQGYRPVLLVQDPARYPYIHTDGCTYLQCDTGSEASVCECIERMAGQFQLAGVFSSSEYFIEMAAMLAQKFHLPGADPVAIKTCRNKGMQRRRFRKAGLHTPAFACATSIQEAVEAATRISLPVILKPTLGTGSVGVRLCRTREQVAEHAGLLLQRTTNERGMLIPSELLVEEYITGPEYSVEVLGSSIVGITSKHLSREPFFVETGHDFPAHLPQDIEQSIADTIKTALRTMGLTWGPAHIELRWSSAGPVVIEVNPRLAGGFIPEIVRLASGIDMISETVRIVVDAAPDLSRTHERCASIRFLAPFKKGVIAKFDGLEEAWKVEGVTDIQMYRRIGDRVCVENDFRDRLGHVICQANLQTQASLSAETAAGKINICVQSHEDYSTHG
jgi:S-sulfo-L-cysteine synthase (3-phospho-L-serine-dependent)